MSTCGEECEVYSRVCGYFRPVSNWNHGKKEEFKDRKKFKIQKLDKYYDPQMGVEYSSFEINSNNSVIK